MKRKTLWISWEAEEDHIIMQTEEGSTHKIIDLTIIIDVLTITTLLFKHGEEDSVIIRPNKQGGEDLEVLLFKNGEEILTIQILEAIMGTI